MATVFMRKSCSPSTAIKQTCQEDSSLAASLSRRSTSDRTRCCCLPVTGSHSYSYVSAFRPYVSTRNSRTATSQHGSFRSMFCNAYLSLFADVGHTSLTTEEKCRQRTRDMHFDFPGRMTTKREP